MNTTLIVSISINAVLLLLLFSPNFCRWIHSNFLIWKQKDTSTLINGNFYKDQKESENNNKYKDFDIEYMPISKLYFPRHKNKYIHRNYPSNRLETINCNTYAESSNTKEGAKEMYDKFLEHQSITSKIIKYP